MAQHTALFNAEVSKQQGEAMEEYSEDMIKIMEVARRIMKGAKVPASDEKKTDGIQHGTVYGGKRIWQC